MTPEAIIARAIGDGVRLILSSPGMIKAAGKRAAVQQWLPTIRAHKPALIEALQETESGASTSGQQPSEKPHDTDSWRAYYAARCAFHAVDADLHTIPEVRAYECCLSEWLNLHPTRSEPGRCAHCSDSGSGETLIPYGTAATGHTWLHVGCWPGWSAARRARAAEVLAAMGIAKPSALI